MSIRIKGLKRILAISQYTVLLPVTVVLNIFMYVRMGIDITISILFNKEYNDIRYNDDISAKKAFSPFARYSTWNTELYRFAIFGEKEYNPLGILK